MHLIDFAHILDYTSLVGKWLIAFSPTHNFCTYFSRALQRRRVIKNGDVVGLTAERLEEMSVELACHYEKVEVEPSS